MIINRIENINCLEGLKTLPNNSIDCCVTSPPYFGLRDYGTATWEGGDLFCSHQPPAEWLIKNNSGCTLEGGMDTQNDYRKKTWYKKNGNCICGAVRIDDQIGLEETPDEYVNKMVEVFTEVKRVLKQEGTLWLNLGDSYASSDNLNEGGSEKQRSNKGANNVVRNIKHGVKTKDLIGIPWMVAFALRSSGWYLRQDIIWHKPNPMPESVTDRCTKSHEYIFLLSKSQKYYYNYIAVQELAAYDGRKHTMMKGSEKYSVATLPNSNAIHSMALNGHERWNKNEAGEYIRNKRSVWTVTTKPYNGAHFATFPEDLICDCIKAGCPEGGIVLDPFMGAGTTALVARKLNRNYLGFELNAEYIKIANQRLYDELGMFL